MKNLDLIFVLLLASFNVNATTYSLVNMGPDFKAYVNQYRQSSPEDQWTGWKSFEGKYSFYFDNVMCSSQDPICQEKKKIRVQKFFVELPSFETKMWELFDRAESITKHQVNKFESAFPDLQENTPVVFMPSLFTFNGRGVRMGAQIALVIGADHTARAATDLDVLFSHEFFHVYQFSKIPSEPDFKTLYGPLWVEGLATWISTYLNPRASDSVALMNKDLGEYCSHPKNVKFLAQEFLLLGETIKSEEEEFSVHRDWFSASSKPGVQRKGYCLGLHAIREVMKTKKISDVVVLREEEFKSLVEAALQVLAK